ncbi:MAG: glutathione S-transferase family protein, partial [Pseudomonadota bacterium]
MVQRLYLAPGTIAVASAIALNETGAAYEAAHVDFGSAEQTKAAYHGINPKGRVPALETPSGILTETIAILEFVAPGLIPDDPWSAARMREVMTYIATTAHVNHAHKMRGHRWADRPESWADMTAKVPETMAASAAYIETKITGPFTLGENFSLADPYLFIWALWLEGDAVDVRAFPKLKRFIEIMERRPSVIRAREEG